MLNAALSTLFFIEILNTRILFSMLKVQFFIKSNIFSKGIGFENYN